ncbi:MAG: helix-turn-helix transcriptional regulator [Oscillospiraceae bacterium]|jgi:transcriptional regulator with XRE-family HTH domain|nr:helix-turn-helix transcriptional regulator [Oscillospiraceae bacterium]
MTLHEVIAQNKKRLRINNEQLSKATGVPKSTIDKITAGTTTDPKLSTLTALANYFGCTIDDLSDIQQKTPTPECEGWDSVDGRQLLADFASLPPVDRRKVVEYAALLAARGFAQQ